MTTMISSSTSAVADAAALLAIAISRRPVSGAVMSSEPDPVYRYALWRLMNPAAVLCPSVMSIIMVNPSTADHEANDPTMASVLRFGKMMGFDMVLVANLFALRAADPKDLRKHCAPRGRMADAWIDAVAMRGNAVFAAWGANGSLQGRGEEVAGRLAAHHDLFCLRLTKSGAPEHPLYLPSSARPMIYRPRKRTVIIDGPRVDAVASAAGEAP